MITQTQKDRQLQVKAWLSDPENLKSAIKYAIAEGRKVELDKAILSKSAKADFLQASMVEFAIQQTAN